MNLIQILKLAVKESRYQDLNEKKAVLAKAKSTIAKFSNEIKILKFTAKSRGNAMLRQKRTISDLNEENDNFAIDIETIKSSHYREVSELLARIKELEKAAKETDEQKGHGLLIEYGGGE
jgi:hypothetical protein